MTIIAPKTSLNIIGAQALQENADQKVVIVGQQLAGTAVSGAISKDVPDSDAAIEDLFGAKSHITRLVKKFKAVNKVSALDVIPLDDNGSAVDSTATITVATGTASADATIVVFIMDKIDFRATVTITSGDNQDAIAAAIDAAMSALEAKFPFVTTSTTNVVTFTGSNGGTIYNGSPIGIEGTIPGITMTIAGFASGATDPVLTDIFDAVGNTRYQTIGWPAAYPTVEPETFLNARFNSAFEVLDGVAITAKNDTFANLTGGPSENSQSLVYIVDNLVDEGDRKGSSIMSLSDVRMAVFCAVRSLRLTEGASLTSIITTVATADQFGGAGTSTLPYQNTLLAGLAIPDTRDEFALSEVASLTDDGWTVAAANKAFNAIVLGTAVTTYKTNVAGDPDTSFHFLNTVDASSTIREIYVINLRSAYAQSRLTGGDLRAGRDMVNEARARAFCKRIYQVLANDAITELGSTAAIAYSDSLVVVIDVSAGKLTIDQSPNQVGGLRTILGTIAVAFSS